jgi:signal transduction histidine kinase
MSAVPLKGAGDGGAVVSYTDITERRQAELEADQSRKELAHFLRVSTVGVMTTSLAHELNQPLTAILANAQAAQRMLALDPPDLAQFREVLSDMIDEDRRAGEIISQLREMLRKGSGEQTVLDVNALVGGVARLVGSDALIRNVELHVALDPGTPPMKGDRTQVQQVVLNLLLNALEAAAESPRGVRSVVVRTGRDPSGMVEISVLDTGQGVPDDLAERVFEPFFTTKTRGMGMGLSIARSIVSAHGGTIWAENRPGGGAAFRLCVPSHAPAS